MDNVFVKSFLDLLHLLATITWFGTLFANAFILRTAITKTLTPETAAPFIAFFMKKTRVVVYTSLAVLFITGIPLKIVNENYVSIINFSNNWQIAMFIKHVLVALLALLAFLSFEYLIPKIKKTALKGSITEQKKMKNLQMKTGMLSVVIAFIIIVISAVMNHI